jgi:hypothetical protein
LQPKAVRQGYEPAPFFFLQTSEDGTPRIVAWASLPTVRRAFEELIKQLPEAIEVLLKVKVDSESEDESSEPDWLRYYGAVAQGALLEAVARCDTFVFQDSRNQLCVRDPASFEYVVLDDVGVVYVYSDDARFGQILSSLGFGERLEPLVDDEFYWVQTPAAGREQETEFVRLLRLSPVPGPGESWEPRAIH